MDLDALITHHTATLSDGVRLHYVEAGRGPLVVLLHGFPEFWYGWRYQIPALVAAGYRVVAPDLRGYNLSDKPEGIDAYSIRRLAQDVADLVRAAGAERATVIGHDWGGGVTWQMAMDHASMLDGVVVLNMPHPARMLKGLKTLKQLLKSWYAVFFQLPFAPERAIRAQDFRFLRQKFRHEHQSVGAVTELDLDRYVEALSQPGALTSALNYYRAAARDAARKKMPWSRIELPVLVIWGERDTALGNELAEPDPKWVPSARVERVWHAGHFVQSDCPERVNALLLEYLEERGRKPAAA
jgi:pimeloyl-ACP methyl ester carboxylesterase